MQANCQHRQAILRKSLKVFVKDSGFDSRLGLFFFSMLEKLSSSNDFMYQVDWILNISVKHFVNEFSLSFHRFC